MAAVDRSQFHYSVTLSTKRREVMYAMRAISMAAQREVNNRIPWSHVTDQSWRAADGCVTFYFTSISIRTKFVEWIKAILNEDTWRFESEDDGKTAPDKA